MKLFNIGWQNPDYLTLHSCEVEADTSHNAMLNVIEKFPNYFPKNIFSRIADFHFQSLPVKATGN